MKRLHFFLLLAGLLLTACGGDDDVTSGGDTPKPVTPSTPTSWSLEITSPVTRGLKGDASGITPTWETTDNIYVYYGNQRVGVLHPKAHKDNASEYVQLEGNLDTPTSGPYSVGDKLSFYYQCDKGFDDYTLQGGTIESIASDYDYHIAENVNITAVDAAKRIVTVGQFNMVPQQAIARFSFTRDLKTNDIITIEENSILASVKLKADVSEGGYVYVALPLSASATSYDLTFTVKRGSDNSFYKTILSNKTLQNGKTYSAALVMAVKLDGVWWATRNLVDPDYFYVNHYSTPYGKFTANETDGGHLFAWGEVHTRDVPYDTPYTAPASIPGNQLSTDNDAAYQLTDGVWRMPTEAEAQKLCSYAENTTWARVTGGMKFSDKTYPDRYITLPAAGYWDANQGGSGEGHYWTSSVWTYKETAPYRYSTRFYFNSPDYGESLPSIWGGARNCGCSIRPVLNI